MIWILLYSLLSIQVSAHVIVNDKENQEIERLIHDCNNESEAVKRILAHDHSIESCTISKIKNDTYINIKYCPTIVKVEVDAPNNTNISNMIASNLKANNLSARMPCNTRKIKEFTHGLSKELHQYGYFNICIHSYIININEHEVVLGFKIDQASQYKIAQVNMKGNKSFSSNKLLRLLHTTKIPFYMSIPGIKYLLNTVEGSYRQSDIDNDVKGLKYFYFKHGYVDAKVTYTTELLNNKLMVNFEIEEGTQYKLGEVRNALSCMNKINKFADIYKERNRARYILQKNIKFEVIRANHDQTDDTINSKNRNNNSNSHNPPIAHIIFKEMMYEPIYVSKIEISGNKRLSHLLIRKIINISEGDIIYKDKIKNIENQLNSFPGISQSDITLQRDHDTNVLLIGITENDEIVRPDIFLKASTAAPITNMKITESFLSDPGVSLNYENRNVLGKGIYFSIQGMKSRLSQGVALAFHNPYFTNSSELELNMDLNKRLAQLNKAVYATVLRDNIDMLHTHHYGNVDFGYGPKFKYTKIAHYKDKQTKQVLNNISRFYTLDQNTKEAILFWFMKPTISFLNDAMGNLLSCGASVSLPLISNENYYTHLSENANLHLSLLDGGLHFRSTLNMSNLYVHKGRVSAFEKLEHMPHVFGFDEINGYGPRDMSTLSLVGATKYIHLRNRFLIPVSFMSNMLGTDVSLFLCSDLVLNNVPQDKEYYLDPNHSIKYHMGNYRSSVSCGLHFPSFPLVQELNIGIAYANKKYTTLNKQNKYITDSGDQTRRLVLTLGKKVL